MFLITRKIILFVLLLTYSIAKSQVSATACKVTAQIDVLIDSVFGRIDGDGWSHVEIIYCGPCYYLRAVDSSYEILGFTTKAELINGKINEASVPSKYFAMHPFAQMNLLFAKKDTDVKFYCIEARHNGGTYHLKPFSIISK